MWFLMRLLKKKEYDKYTTLLRDVGNGGGHASVGGGDIRELSTFIQYCCEPKKVKSILKVSKKKERRE